VHIRYSTFLPDDGLTFVNIVATETSSGLAPLGQLQAYRQIQQGKYDRFDQPPQVTQPHELGTYRVFEGRGPGHGNRVARDHSAGRSGAIFSDATAVLDQIARAVWRRACRERAVHSA
jgi:hypothetical protein